ncbi:hypothetical protein [Methylorubrum extorquens]|uniref:Uncharacterized protein n=1 Tax=Methylorubrum extorquens (strain CM4 / NCIMB 13688) TaxID=440085 RepID=B7KST5_METC4|nr:hypothetical protein [Methylorubrum extorquens]ACK82437.1 conserved hypothetical protein [Methylorubrum extorquens CM4]
MPAPDRTVADWIAEGLTTMALHCSCGHYATVKLADLPPRMTRTRLGQNARCAECGKQGAQVMLDMKAHYAEMEAKGGFSAGYLGGKG